MSTLEVITRHPSGEPCGAAPLLLIHGFWHAAWAWQNYQEVFAERGYASHAISLVGHGGTPGSARRAGLGTHLRTLRRYIDGLPSPPILIGHSMGGYLVQRLLAERVFPAAVLLASVPAAGVGRSACRATWENPLVLAECLAQWSMRPVVGTPERARRWLYSKRTRPEIVERTFARLCHESFPLFIRMHCPAPRPRPENRRILVVGGGADAFFKSWEFEATADRCGAARKLFPALAHNLTDDEPPPRDDQPSLRSHESWKSVVEFIVTWLGNGA